MATDLGPKNMIASGEMPPVPTGPLPSLRTRPVTVVEGGGSASSARTDASPDRGKGVDSDTYTSAQGVVQSSTVVQENGQKANTDPAAQEGRKPAQADLEEAVGNVREFVQNIRRNLEFTVDRDTGQQIIKVIDSETEKVIRQIPPEEIVKISKRLGDVSGLFLSAEA